MSVQPLSQLCLGAIVDHLPAVMDLFNEVHLYTKSDWFLSKSTEPSLPLLEWKLFLRNDVNVETRITFQCIWLASHMNAITIPILLPNEGDCRVDPLTLVRLLSHPKWASKLTSLSLIGTYSQQYPTSSYRTLVDTINTGLPRLEHLTLFGALNGYQYDLKIIGQLKEFVYMQDIDTVDRNQMRSLDRWLNVYVAKSASLCQIELYLDQDEVSSFYNMLMKIPSELAKKFTRLFDEFKRDDDSAEWGQELEQEEEEEEVQLSNERLTRLCLHFSNLKSITLLVDAKLTTFTKRVACLAPLVPVLDSLELHLFSDGEPLDMQNQLAIGNFVRLTRLYLSVYSFTSEEALQVVKSIQFGHLFPNVKEIWVGIFSVDRTLQDKDFYEAMIPHIVEQCEVVKTIDFSSYGGVVMRRMFHQQWNRNAL